MEFLVIFICVILIALFYKYYLIGYFDRLCDDILMRHNFASDFADSNGKNCLALSEDKTTIFLGDKYRNVQFNIDEIKSVDLIKNLSKNPIEIILKFTINNFERPIHSFEFITGTHPDLKLHKVIDRAELWENRIKYLMENKNKTDERQTT